MSVVGWVRLVDVYSFVFFFFPSLEREVRKGWKSLEKKSWTYIELA